MNEILNRVYIKKLINQINDELGTALALYKIELNNNNQAKEKLKFIIDSYLSSLKNSFSLVDYDCKVKKLTWEDIYLSFSKKLAAKFAYYLIRKSIFHNYNSNDTDIKFKWYHCVFPFKKILTIINPELSDLQRKWYDVNHDYSYIDESKPTEAEILNEWCNVPIDWLIKNNKPIINVEAYIDNPNGYLTVDINLQPIPAVECINLNFVINKKV